MRPCATRCRIVGVVNRTLVSDARSNHVLRCIGAGSGSRCARPKTSTARSPVTVTIPRTAPGMRAETASATEPVAAARISAAVTVATLSGSTTVLPLIQASADRTHRSISGPLQPLGCTVSGSYAASRAPTGPNIFRCDVHPGGLRTGPAAGCRGSRAGAEQRAVRRPGRTLAAFRAHALRAVQPRGSGGDRGTGMAPVRPACG